MDLQVRLNIRLPNIDVRLLQNCICQLIKEHLRQLHILSTGIEHIQHILFGQSLRVLHDILIDLTDTVLPLFAGKGGIFLSQETIKIGVQNRQCCRTVTHNTGLTLHCLVHDLQHIHRELIIELHGAKCLFAVSCVVGLCIYGQKCILCARSKHRDNIVMNFIDCLVNAIAKKISSICIGLNILETSHLVYSSVLHAVQKTDQIIRTHVCSYILIYSSKEYCA